ncbi:MAG: M14 family zinc carboxypeptidase [Leeuwenhoekiella sp.]
MTRFFTLFILFSFFSANLFAQDGNPTLDYYLPQDVTYDSNIPTPQEILGWVPGTWHVSHDKLVDYMKTMAASSPRITIEDRGQTFEGRPLLLLIITSPENHKNIEAIKKQHMALTQDGASTLNTEDMPLVTYQGMSIHGNEPSGANAGLLAAYYLAAAQGPKIEELLKNTVILFDPSFNPDGLQRFAYWANTNKARNIIADPQDREYDEIWPGGRTNHYWFDLNRDWLPTQLPESQARIKTFHEWYPNILTDHHEMGSNSSFFFQPGIQSRTHPLTPALNQELTKEIGKFHAAAFDKLGSFYFTEESYDDFYYGKGSTFPDINGGIGILFEQASSRGHAQMTDNGLLEFKFTIRNQFTAFLSTLEAARNLRVKLLNYERDFYADSRKEAGNDAYIFGSKNDAGRSFELASLLKRQNIEIYKPAREYSANGKTFTQANSYVVPKKQKHSRMLEAMFEKRTMFTDSLFYDISAWTLPLAFNLDFSDAAPASLAGPEITDLQMQKPAAVTLSKYAYLMPWGNYFSPKALNKILEKGLRAKVSLQPFSVEGKDYDYGTILIPVQNQDLSPEEMQQFLNEVSQESNVEINTVSTGITEGIDLGSRYFIPLKPTKLALIVGEGISYNDAGEIWHLLDTRYDIKVTKLDTRDFDRFNLSKYTDIIIPSIWGNALDDDAADKLKEWTKNGGTIIGYGNTIKWLKRNNFINISLVKTENPAKTVTFEQMRDFNGAQEIGGAIFQAKLDRSNPINFGYNEEYISLFRDNTIFIEADETSYNNPIRYTDSPLESGYISKINLNALKETRPFVHSSLGRGNVMLFTDNTNFRAFWYGTNKLLMNAIFFDNAM